MLSLTQVIRRWTTGDSDSDTDTAPPATEQNHLDHDPDDLTDYLYTIMVNQRQKAQEILDDTLSAMPENRELMDSAAGALQISS